MLLHQLFERPDYAHSIELRLQSLKKELKEIMKVAASGFQSGIKPEYTDKVKNKRRQIEVATKELEHAKQRWSIEDDLRAKEKAAKEKADAITPEDKKKEFVQSIVHGFDVWKELRATHGGDDGLNSYIHKLAIKQTDDGKHPLDVDKLAKEIGIPSRSLYKRLESPKLFSTSALTPNHRK